MTEEWRDLEKDLKLCEQMPGDDWYAHATDDKCCACAQYVSTVPGLFGHDGRRGLEEGGNRQVNPSTVIAITLLQNPHLAVHDSGEWDKLTRFIAQSKKGWPYAIRRAMSAEARRINSKLEQLKSLRALVEKTTTTLELTPKGQGGAKTTENIVTKVGEPELELLLEFGYLRYQD